MTTADTTADTLIRGGEVWIGSSLSRVDVAISDGLISAVGPALDVEAAETIDAEGLLVLPGGIDVHTHFHTEVGGGATADRYESGTRAAAFGGLTTILNYAFQDRGERLVDVVRREQKKAAGQSYIDHSFHIIVTDLSVDGLLAELHTLPELGCPSIKLFTTMDFRLSDAELLQVLDAARGAGVLVNVHAEDGSLIDYNTERLLGAGARGIDQLGPSRPPRAEALAVEKMVTYAGATGTPLYIVHLSSTAGLDAVRRGRADGIEVYVETRPAYLFLDEDRYGLPDHEGNKYACFPPLRSRSDQDTLWAALASGEIQTYATDHTTWTVAQKMDPDLDFPQVPGGMSNVQTSVGMLWTEGVHGGRLSMSRFVELIAESPAKLFGLWPAKGAIRVGSDADLMLLDPTREYRVVSEKMQSASDFDPYDGYTSHGWPVRTISRGRTVVNDEQLVGSVDHGRFVARAAFSTPS